MYLYWTRTDSHRNIQHKGKCVCVDTERKEVMGGQSPLLHHSQMYTLNGCDEKVLQ